jgi:hypothetical protein
MQTRWNHAAIVAHKQITSAQVIADIAKNPVLNAAIRPV